MMGAAPDEARRDVDRLAATWDEHGRQDPLWAILTQPGERTNPWDVDAFFATGRCDVDALVARFREVGIEPHGRALDFGCGVGRLTEALADHCERVDGVDISAAMVDGAQRYSTHAGARYHVNVADDLRLFESESFNLVHSQIVLQHVGTTLARAYIREFVRVLAPGGIVHFQLPTTLRWNAAGMMMRCLPEAVNNRLRKMRMQGIPEREVRDQLVSLGVEVLDVGPDSAAGPRWNSRHYTAVKSH